MERKKGNKNTAAKTRRSIIETLKFSGLSVRPDCIDFIIEHHVEIAGDMDGFLQMLLRNVDKTSLKGNILGTDDIKGLIEFIKANEADVRTEDHELQIIDAFQVPHVEYDETRKAFFNPPKESAAPRAYFSSSPKKRVEMYKKRYHLVAGRNLRHKAFRKRTIESLGRSNEQSQFDICPIRSLYGGKGGVKYVFGMICNTGNGLILEDDTASVKLSLDELKKQDTGYFMENCLVIAEGELRDGIYHAYTLVMPILEPREESLRYLDEKVEFFCSRPSKRIMDELSRRERTRSVRNQSIVVLSDVLLDRENTFKYLRNLLGGWSKYPPRMIVFIGDFFSDEFRQKMPTFRMYQEFFEEFAKVLKESVSLVKESNTQFLFVPGPNDPLMNTVLPLPRLSRELTSSLSALLGERGIFTSNPCRIRFFTKEIVIFREDLQYKFISNTLLQAKNAEEGDQVGIRLPWQHLIKTIVSQAHLCPLPMTVIPVSWEYDEAMYLHPHPHCLILADKCKNYMMKYFGLAYFNPGSFAEDGTFVTMRLFNEKKDFTFNRATLA